jgi:glycosyltransferase involved in cell wall biosynthesis
MRLLMTADAVGGVWTYALELARALVPHGVQTTIATMGPAPDADQLADAAQVPGINLVTSTFKLEWMEDPWSDLEAAGRWLLGIARRVQTSMVHLNGYAHAALPWHAPTLVVGHSCVASWADAVGGSIDVSWMARYRRTVTAGLRAADYVVAPTQTMLDALQRHYGPLPSTSVVANGRDATKFRAAAKEPFVFTAGRLWDAAKNADAMRAVAASLPWPVVIAGDPKLSEAEIARLLSRASIFALPARYEPFGLLPLEAALSGCALVLGDIPSFREVWGDAAIYVPPDDRFELRAAIDRLIANDALRLAYADRARLRAAVYTPDRMAEQYMRIYESLSCGASQCAS